jgi:peptide deformylase
MAKLPIIEAPDPILKTISKPVKRVDDDLRTFMDDMLDTMYAAPGIGLAAIQVGVPIRVLVLDIMNNDEKPKPQYFVNPEIISVSDDLNSYNEGCLSVPEQYAIVERPSECRVKFLDYNGEPQQIDAKDLLATCIQHEMDHLEGILFLDHISTLRRQMILKKLQKGKL